MSLHDAVAKYVENGDVLATGGFTTNRKPYAAVSEILRQGQKDFIVYAGPGGGEVDMLIGEGRVAAYINCYTANSGYTNVSRRFRAAIEKGQLTYEDYSQDVLMLMLHASSLGLPFLPVRLMQGSGLMKYWGISEEKRKTMPKMEDLKCVEIENPMVPGQKVVAVPVPRIDTALIHVQQASPDGTCIICGDEFHDIDIAVAARKTIVTCEEIVSNEYIRRDPTKTRIFGECVQAVVKAPYGAWPAQCYDYYDDDDAALKEYDKASKYQDAEDAKAQLEKAAVKAEKAAAAICTLSSRDACLLRNTKFRMVVAAYKFKNTKTTEVIPTYIIAYLSCVLLKRRVRRLPFKIISNSPLGQNVLRLCRIGLQFFPEAANVDVHGSNVAAVLISPDGIQKSLPGVHPVGVAHEKFDDVKLFGR